MQPPQVCSCGQQTDKVRTNFKDPSHTLYRRNDRDIIDPVTLKSTDTTQFESALKVANFHCNCKYLWLRELHGLSAFMMSNSLRDKIFWAAVILTCAAYSIYNTVNILNEYSSESTTTLITILPTKNLKFPTMVFCPRSPDFFNYYNVLKDLYKNVGYMENNTNYDILRYAMTGFGMDNAESEFFNETYRDAINGYYLQWRGNRSQYEMFDFMFNKNGFTCQDMFQTCYGGSATYNCCDIFEPFNVMLRGRCFRLIDTYYQNDTDEVSKLSIFFNNMTSRLTNTGIPPQLVFYNGDSNYEVGLYPRIYLNQNDWNRIRFEQKVLKLIPSEGRCSTEPIYQGKFTCFVYKWLMQIYHQFNCTVPYLKYSLSYLADIPICEPLVMVSNFHNISLTPATQGYKCTPACSRTENSVQLLTSMDYDPDPSYMFRLEASFTYLEYEQYTEVRKTSIPGFISELGGQTGLFVGCSIMTVVQLINSIVVQIYKRTHRYVVQNGWMVWLGLFTTHETEPVDKYYMRPPKTLEIIHPTDLPPIPEEIDETSDEASLKDGENSELQSIALTNISDTDSIEDFHEEKMKSSENGDTIRTWGSEPLLTTLELPEDVRLAKFVWIRTNSSIT